VAPVASPFSHVCAAPKTKGFASCLALRAVKGRTGLGIRMGAASAPSGYGPSDLLSAYNLPSDGGAGATIAIVDAYDDPSAAADLAVYRSQFGLPPLAPGQLRKVNEQGLTTDYPVGDPGWATEISLDLDMVSAIAPKANIILVEANSTSMGDLGASVNEAVALGASYVSNSYGGGENTSDPQFGAEYYDHPGVAVVASSGDSAFQTLFPSSDPHVTAVGGTSLTKVPGTARGWTETAWHDGGSGCSPYEAKPSFQTDTGCAHRTIADVSAVADPDTGVAVYDSYGNSGWGQYGGTSVSSPFITATFALGGPIASGDYPNADPYKHTASLNDVTSGSNGTCSPAYLCTAGPGYDGPTGLGTPDGTAAFTDAASGVISGTVTSSAGTPIADAIIKAVGPSSATTFTAADGSYRMPLVPGTYSLSVTAYGYLAGSATGVTVTAGGSTAQSFSLTTAPTVTVSGRVTDGSGHGWPVQSAVLVNYVTGTTTVYTNPYNGRYSVKLPGDASYVLSVTPLFAGYQNNADTKVTLGTKNATQDFSLQADLLASNGSALGYTQHTSGISESFGAGTLPPGWTTQTTGVPWTFAGGAAEIDADSATDASLYTPAVPVPAGQTPCISFHSYSVGSGAEAYYSMDGGATWQPVWNGYKDSSQPQITLPAASTARTMQVRFRFQADEPGVDGGGTWLFSDVQVGTAWLTADPGGLVAGTVQDGNTGKTLDGVSLTVPGGSPATVTSAAADGMDGFYWLFSPAGHRTVTGTMWDYSQGTSTVTVAADNVTQANVAMPTGRLVASGNVTATVAPGGTAEQTVTLSNTGDGPATVAIDQFTGTTTPSSATTSASMAANSTLPGKAASDETLVHRFLAAKGKAPQTAQAAQPARTAATAATVAGATAAASGPAAWSSAANMPITTTQGVAATYKGVVYAGLGISNLGYDTPNLFYSYNPAADAWQQEASAPEGVGDAAYGLIGDQLYVTGGITAALLPESSTEVYDIATNTWSQVAADPYTLGGVGAVANGKLYVIGGISASTYQVVNTVAVYDPATNTWSQAPSYPDVLYTQACGTISGTIYCAGGAVAEGLTTDAFGYTPGDQAWHQIASLPIGLALSAYSAADGRLLLSGGVTNEGLTSAGFSYNPAMNWWTALPAAGMPKAGALGAMGFYTIGGENSTRLLSDTDVLSGYDQAGQVSLPWLSATPATLTIQPGRKATVVIGLNASGTGLTSGGTVTGTLGFESDTPYAVTPVTVSLTVK
jgi:hypothetical protein